MRPSIVVKKGAIYFKARIRTSWNGGKRTSAVEVTCYEVVGGGSRIARLSRTRDGQTDVIREDVFRIEHYYHATRSEALAALLLNKIEGVEHCSKELREATQDVALVKASFAAETRRIAQGRVTP